MPIGVYKRKKVNEEWLKKYAFKKGNKFRFKKGNTFSKGANNRSWKGGITKSYKIERSSSKPNQCEVCGSMGKICYDHDHNTNKFRGWICWRCNLALGLVKDNTETLISLAEYIKKFRKG